MGSKVEVYRRADRKWAWRLKAANGEIIATDGGQGYENRADAATMIATTLVALNAAEVTILGEDA